MTLLAGFDEHDVEVGEVTIHAAVAGSGPPLLLLHGYPQTHAMWHAVAPRLAVDVTVVAADQVALMERLGHETFAVAGHDRGARVTHRMCRDHPERVTRAAVLDIVPTTFVFDNTDLALAKAYYHWFFLSQPPELPERLIAGDPEYYLRRCLGSWSRRPGAFAEEVFAEYLRYFADPATITATCEDYRAAISIDLEHDRADDARIRCALLVLWGGTGVVGTLYDVLAVWREAASDPALVTGRPMDCGHFMPEEEPEETYRALREFFTA